MNKRIGAVVLSLGILVSLVSLPAQAAQVWISDIQANPSRYWNTTVTIIGQVQGVTANPAGTTRGFYTVLDDSSPTPLSVRTSDLPPVGKTFAVTGTIIQDPTQADVTLMKELRRSAPGMSSMMKYVLIAAAALFFILIIVLIVVLTRPKSKASTSATIRPVSPPPSAPDLGRTTKLPGGGVPAAGDRTQVFASLGAEITAEKGPDKGAEFTLHRQVTTIGRAGSRKNDIELNDDTVSKEQASIYYDGLKKQFSIANESATNPTKVNGQIIAGPTLLEDGTVIEMGRTTLRFRKE